MERVYVGVQGRRDMEERTHLLLKASLCRLKSLHLILVLRADPLSECLQLTTCLPVLLKHGCRGGTQGVPPSSYNRGAHSLTLAPSSPSGAQCEGMRGGSVGSSQSTVAPPTYLLLPPPFLSISSSTSLLPFHLLFYLPPSFLSPLLPPFPSSPLLLSPHSPLLSPTLLPSLLSPSPSSDCLIRARMLISASCRCSCSFSRFSSASLACRV